MANDGNGAGTRGGAAPAAKGGRALLDSRSLIIRLLSENARAFWPGYAAAFTLMAIVAATTGLSAWIMRDVINQLFVDRDGEAIRWIAIAVAAIFITKGAAMYAQAVILNRIGNAVVARVQRRLFDRVLAQRLDFFDAFPVGDLATRLSHNATAARHALNALVTGLGRDALTVVALVVVMIVQDPQLSLIALVMAPPAIWGVSTLIRRVKKIARAEFVSLTQIVSTVQETVLGMRVVQAFGLEDRMRARMGAAIEDVRRRADSLAVMQTAPIPLMETLAGLVIAAVILYAGERVVAGTSDPGAFFSFLTALLLAYDPARRVAQMSVTLRNHLVGVELMYDLLDREPKLAEAPHARPLAVTAGEVHLEAVAFRYAEREGRASAEGAGAPTEGATADGSPATAVEEPRAQGAPALEAITLTAEAGKVTALVGPSGAGKSTVFALVERFFDPDSGRVTIDGQDIRETTLPSLRAALAHVGQEAFLFDTTVAE
ncbi:MAG: ABC transporter ATP-binding protein, partial [Pseudomonadota bacterium]